MLAVADRRPKKEVRPDLSYMDYKNLPKVMSVGAVIFVDDNLIELMVKSIDVAASTMECEVMNTGKLGSKKGATCPRWMSTCRRSPRRTRRI